MFIIDKIIPTAKKNIDWKNISSVSKYLLENGFKYDYGNFYFEEDENYYQMIPFYDKYLNYVYIFIPLYYLSKNNDDGDVVPFINNEEYLVAIKKYNLVFELFYDQLRIVLGKPIVINQYKCDKASYKDYNNWGNKESYKYVVWELEHNYLVLQQDISDLTSGFEDDIDFAIIDKSIFNKNKLPLSRINGNIPE
jgi:hypothetical protein